MPKSKDIFNPAFKSLQHKLEEALKSSHKPEVAPPTESGKGKKDDDLFMDAMSDVTPVPGNKKIYISHPGKSAKPTYPPPDKNKEVMTHLYGLVKGTIDMDITFSDEYMEGSVRSFSKKLMKKLKKGEFPVKNHIDLHGMTKKEAEIEVQNFLIKSYKMGHRCVLIVHGRGLNSPDSFPVLKEGLPRWLSRGPVKKLVLAFSTARPYDGGTGAIYVLLKRR